MVLSELKVEASNWLFCVSQTTKQEEGYTLLIGVVDLYYQWDLTSAWFSHNWSDPLVSVCLRFSQFYHSKPHIPGNPPVPGNLGQLVTQVP